MMIVIRIIHHDVDCYLNLLNRAGLEAGQPCQTLLQVHWPVDQTAKLVIMVMVKMIIIVVVVEINSRPVWLVTKEGGMFWRSGSEKSSAIFSEFLIYPPI